MEKHISTLTELEHEAALFLQSLVPEQEKATLITLSGSLGAGKTAFTKAVAKLLGVEEVVTSPTFVLEKIYELPAPPGDAGFLRLIHIDAYRLERGSDLAPLDFDECMRDRGNLILLEWPEMVADALPQPMMRITMRAEENGSRTITYD